MRGRKPTPTVLHSLHGNPGKRGRNLLEPIPEGQLVDPPAWMTDAQQDDWHYALKHAPAMLLTPIDRDILAGWVVAVGLHRQATVAQQDNPLITVVNGFPMQSPYIAVINKQIAIMVKLASELGFSPAARPRLSVERKDGKGSNKAGSFQAFLDEGEARSAVN